MKKYVIKYYFGKEFYVSRIIESDLNEEGVYAYYHTTGSVRFKDKKNVYYSFLQEDVKYMTVSEYKPAVVTAKRF